MPSRRPASPPSRLNRLALALAPAAFLLLASPLATAAVTVTGTYWLNPGSNGSLGPGNINLPGSLLYLNAGSSFAASAGSTVALARFSTDGVGALSGSGTRLTLSGDGAGSRFEVGSQGSGTFSVSAGATLDGRADAAACLTAPRYCSAFVGNAAGASGVLTVTDAGSSASFLGGFYVGGLAGLNQGFGTPGGFSHGTVNVVNGGVLRTDFGTLGLMTQNAYSLGTERIQATVLINGAGSTWQVTGSSLDSGGAAFDMALGARTQAAATVSGGGLLNIAPGAGRDYGLHVGFGGDATLDVVGAGSQLQLVGDTDRGVLNIAKSGGSGVLSVREGATLSSTVRWVGVGTDGGNGRLTVTGAGSSASFSSLTSMNIGDAGTGRLEVLNGGVLSTAQLNVGRQPGGSGTVSIDGADSRVTLSQVSGERLYVGTGAVTVSNGAVLDTRVNAAACAGGVWCATVIGAQAGANGSLAVTGAGSRASLIGNFQAGITNVATPAVEGWTDGVVGGQTVASVQVLDGGVIQADSVQLGLGTFSASANGNEGAVVNLAIRGAGSRLQVTGSGGSANFSTVVYNARNTVVNMVLSDGGKLQLQGAASAGASLVLSGREGLTQLTARGADSAIEFGPVTTGLNQLVAGTNGGTARLSFAAGAALTGVNYVVLGSGGGLADLRVDGTGSGVDFNANWATLNIGQRGGQGSLGVSGGAQVLMHSDLASTLRVGFLADASGAPGNGSLSLSGAGSTLSLRSGLAGDASTANPIAHVGEGGNGSLVIRDGAALRVEGLAPADPALFLQGAALVAGLGTAAPSSGRVEVNGAGSRLDVLGTNPFITIGSGPYGSGQLSIRDGAVVQTTLMGIADFGASGITQVDNATLKLDGAWHSGGSIGASLAVGTSTGSSGVLSLSHGARLVIGNSGSERTQLALGGLDFAPGGSGTLTVAGGSSVSVGGGGGGQIVIGNTAGGIGTASVQGGSQVSASYVGVGALDGADAGVGTLLVQDTSTVTADHIEIGAKGFVGGTGTLVGAIVNRGVFSPGNSPGTLHVQGSFANQAGGRLVLDVASDGHGGFITDQLIFDAGSTVSLGALQIQFRFLGATDPNAFQASGEFTTDTFLRAGSAALDHALLSGASYSASSSAYQFTSFSFSADGGAVFQAQAVPEPQTWLLFAVGLGLGGWLQRRRRAG
jgi:T5SS/PEP-CTERM-associated repeat protein